MAGADELGALKGQREEGGEQKKRNAFHRKRKK